MLKFLHLSDLHFVTDDEGTQFDRDKEIREALLRDLHGDRAHFDAVLISGDITYNGRAEEYKKASEWFDMILHNCGVPIESLFTIPGNHDVNREYVKRQSIMWDAHMSLRAQNDVNKRDVELRTKLKDQSFDFLHHLSEYRTFAAQHGRLSATSSQELAWSSILTSPLEGDIPVRLHGLNSAFLSNSEDQRANLLVSPFQFTKLATEFSGINIVMCHHPPSWLLDGNEVEDRYRAHARVVITGHEHTSRCFPMENCLRVCAGAVHPSRGEANWNPGYNVIRLSADQEAQQLLVQVETRIWDKVEFCFALSPYGNSSFYEYRTPLPAQNPTPAAETMVAPPASVVLTEGTMPEIVNDAQFAAARRKLIIHFLRLGPVSRLGIAISAGVFEDTDDELEGQARWARVFERAETSKKLHKLWALVAEQDESLQGVQNPFPSEY